MNLVVDGHDVYAYTGAKDFQATRDPLIFVHGGGLDHTVWLLQSRYFAHHGHGVMAVDLPAHGKSGGVALASIPDMADWVVRRNNFKFFDLLYRTWCPTWENYEERLASTKETFNAPGVLGWTLSYYRNCIFGLNAASFKFRRIYNGTVKVPTLGIRGDVDGCIPEVAWNVMRPKSFPNGLTLEMMPGIGHFPQLEDPEWVSERLVRWVEQHSGAD